jgi:Flp pilus assembly protein TadG
MDLREKTVGAKPMTGMPAALSKISCLFRALRSNRSGGVAALAAIVFPAVVGGVGLGAEAGFWYMKQRQLQHAADLAAHAAGTRRRAGDSDEAVYDVAVDIASKAGYVASAGTLIVHGPPDSGEFADNPDAVEVEVTRQLPRLFTAIFRDDPVSLGARAVALVRDGQEACVLALSATAPGAVKISGSSLVELNNCDLASNSLAADSVLMSGGSAALKAGCVYAVGEIVETTRLTLTECEAAKEYAAVTADPYKSVAEPTNLGGIPVSSQNTGSIEAAHVYAPGVKALRFQGGLTIHGAVTFGPGLYVIDGGTFKANAGATISGAGVTFFLTNGATAALNGSATLALSAPAVGPYSGLTFFGSRAGTGLTHQVNGNSGSIVEGAVYFPASHVQFSGNSKTSGGGGCTQVIGNTVELTGNSSLRSTCESSGTRDLLANRFVRLVE